MKRTTLVYLLIWSTDTVSAASFQFCRRTVCVAVSSCHFLLSSFPLHALTLPYWCTSCPPVFPRVPRIRSISRIHPYYNADLIIKTAFLINKQHAKNMVFILHDLEIAVKILRITNTHQIKIGMFWCKWKADVSLKRMQFQICVAPTARHMQQVCAVAFWRIRMILTNSKMF